VHIFRSALKHFLVRGTKRVDGVVV